MEQVLFIVWRECVEAMLVVGILHAWMSHNGATARSKCWLWGGVVVGLLLAGLLGAGLFVAAKLLTNHQDAFQAGMALIAAVLIIQMVLWMRTHGPFLKDELESGLAQQVKNNNMWGILCLVAIAVSREGSELVVFLYGLLADANITTLANISLAALAGFILAWFTFWLLQLGGRYLSWRLFFNITETMLLFLAAALLINGTDRLISMDLLPPLIDPVWNSTALLDDMSPTGGVISALTGYRSHPALITVLIYIGYWLLIYILFHWRRGRKVIA